eukprot:scaffold1498_cov180-Ochromonas_danica.AAC.32
MEGVRIATDGLIREGELLRELLNSLPKLFLAKDAGELIGLGLRKSKTESCLIWSGSVSILFNSLTNQSNSIR